MFLAGSKIKIKQPANPLIEKVIASVEAQGFVLDYIQTSGESSYHMGEYSFEEKYNSLQDYYENADKNYEELRKNGMYSVSWLYTHYNLKNIEKNVKLALTVCTSKNSGSICFFRINNSLDYDEEYVLKIKEQSEKIFK